ncbi:hypothetical protein BC827DRAFT_1088287, partial [Russula dissimulans]
GNTLLTLSSKEAANWLNEADNVIAFTDALAKGSHIKQRSYNLIVPGILITFDPGNEAHLHKIEEVSNLPRFTITNARWIKPLSRR